jgi:hypothetical protein
MCSLPLIETDQGGMSLIYKLAQRQVNRCKSQSRLSKSTVVSQIARAIRKKKADVRKTNAI